MPGRVLRALASLKLTLVILVALGAGVLVAYQSEVRTTWALVVPLALFAVNLAAAVATNPAFRRQTALLVFHLALIAIVLLVAAGRLSYLKGRVELAQGMPFEGELTSYEAGPLHRWRLDRVRFVNEGFTIHYLPGPRRADTRNSVRWLDKDGQEHSNIIGDHNPLVIHGYRFYTTFNKGFATVFVWSPEGGQPQRGAVNLPPYPTNEFRQAQEWTPPGSDISLWIMLRFDDMILDPAKPSQFRLPKDHTLVLRVGDVRNELKPGQSLAVPGGVLRYEGLRSWMGYTVFYDWTIPWLLAACLVAVLSLSWHFWVKFFGHPWDPRTTGSQTDGA